MCKLCLLKWLSNYGNFQMWWCTPHYITLCFSMHTHLHTYLSKVLPGAPEWSVHWVLEVQEVLGVQEGQSLLLALEGPAKTTRCISEIIFGLCSSETTVRKFSYSYAKKKLHLISFLMTEQAVPVSVSSPLQMKITWFLNMTYLSNGI